MLFRSAGLKVAYLDDLPVTHGGRTVPLGPLLRYDARAEEQHELDRTQVYGSSYLVRIASGTEMNRLD